MATNNLFSLFSGGTKNRELKETHASWERVEREWHASPLATIDAADFADSVVRDAVHDTGRVLAQPIIAALCETTDELIRAEAVTELEVIWPVIERDIEAAIQFRRMIARRSQWATGFERMRASWGKQLGSAYQELVKALPEVCFGTWEDKTDAFDVPLIDLLDNPAAVVERLINFPFSDEALTLNLFEELRAVLRSNILAASGISSLENIRSEPKIVPPTTQHGKSARELADLYLAGTPFAQLMEVPVPFAVPDEVRFEHCHVIGGTGHGKTQLLQKMIHTDLLAAQSERRSVVVIDSQGDLIAKLSHLELFSPHVPGGLGDRLMLIDPSDITHPVALNLFDAHLDRLKDYDPVDRERVLNGVVELYEKFFDALLGAELTQRQDVVFRYLARLMITIPGATIQTLMSLMQDGREFKPHMEKLEGSARRFFETEFFNPSFAATKGQILKRLWGVLSTPAFERMFSQPENKIDLFAALNEGKIILVNTAKDLLKEEGSQIFGRFFIAMLAQAALERSTLRAEKRTPTFVYVDEAHEYFDDGIETILNQARKFNVGITIVHQTLDQLSVRLRAALLSNTSMKCVGGVSAKDSRALAEELHTTPEFIDGMRRRGPRTEFAVWVKHVTPHAVRMSVPLGFLERQYTLDEEDYDLLLETNRQRYCGTLETTPELALPSRDIAFADRDTRFETPIVSQVPEPPSRPNQDVARSPEFRTEQEPRGPRTSPARDPGKGGPKHRYLQSLVKELAEQQGLRATIEAPLPTGGQVDVLIEREGVIAAVEISVTTPVEHERENLRKCLGEGYKRIAVVLAKSKTVQTSYRTALLEAVSEADRERVTLLTPEELPDFIASLAPPPEPSERVVKGYRVRGSLTSASPEEARARREAVTRLIAKSLIMQKEEPG